MKRKIKDDINGNPSVKNASDYSRPKMVMVRGHDICISGLQLFFIRFFDLGINKYIYPIYTSQMTFEITREDVDDEKLKYLQFSDYKVNYYFNDKLIMNITFEKFAEIIEKVVWNDDRLYEFCVGDIKEKEKEKFGYKFNYNIIYGHYNIYSCNCFNFCYYKNKNEKRRYFGR